MAKKRSASRDTKFDKIPFRMHPRVFAALGADLVTNDVVAVIELVKNSYDAFAENVWIRFELDKGGGESIIIEDDGFGMSRAVIEDVWCVVATPFKADNPKVKSGRKDRRVAGEKGLGRLSVARLGSKLQLITQTEVGRCWELVVDWSELASEEDLITCFARCRTYAGKSPFEESGTRLRIENLESYWGEAQINDLEENLARLISPFASHGDFNIYISAPDRLRGDSGEVRIESPTFLSHPKYSIVGHVDARGNVQGRYNFKPIKKGKPRTRKLSHSWEQIYDDIQDRTRFRFSDKRAHCGPFDFELRAWDLGPEDTQEIADKFECQRNQVRKAIRAHKGLSVYRDGILVLPKSEGARDWLGLDLRRVSKVGDRMSTSQLVGYVSITAKANPNIVDTSDRERLVSRLEVGEFEEILKSIVGLLENERDFDRVKREPQQTAADLFEELSAEELLAEVLALAEEGAEASEAVPLLKTFNKSLDIARKTIQERFVYYSRMATIGTIAQMLVHEIRNRTTSFGTFLDFIKDRFGPFNDDVLARQYRYAENSVIALERLADTFSPLASRSFTRRKRRSILEERINNCLDVMQQEIDRKHISVSVPSSESAVAVDPGELEAVILNLLTNATYWLGQRAKDAREMQFRFSPIDGGKRLRVWFHDSGPGIEEEDAEKILLPGVTRKPGGIGMGLTVASEIVASYGGRMTIKQPGTLGGASFAFDIPAVESVQETLKTECLSDVRPFEEAEKALDEFLPDIVVLDILESGSSGEPDPVGKTTYDVIWEKRFCPIVVYSAHPELLSEGCEDHPFVRFVQKGRGSDQEIKMCVQEFRPHVKAVRETESRIRREVSLALRDVAPDAFRIFAEEEDRRNAIVRSAQRRLAALMDDLSRHGEKLQGWEQYLSPPVGEDVRLGDILQQKDGSNEDPSSFFVVLTPSCDLVASGGRSAKVGDVLVASCVSVVEGINATGLGQLSKKKLKERLPSSLLSQGFLDGIIPLPKLEGRLPTMAANVRRLKLIPVSHVTSESSEYSRVSSIDSPFKELIAWAYMQTACRPGLPDRDFDSWRGLTRGLIDAGLEVVGGFDVDEGCAESYESNNPSSKFNCSDIRDIDVPRLRSTTRLRKFEDVLFVGCAPCQPFSQQRRRRYSGENTTLLTRFGALVETARPRAVLMENVPGMARVGGFSTFKRFVRMLGVNGYAYTYDILDAKYFGVPQTRRRLVLVAVRGSDVCLPSEVYGGGGRPLRTVRDAISHFPEVSAGECHEDVPNHVSASITDKNLERLVHTPHDGGDRRSWPRRLQLNCHKNGYAGHTDVYGRMAWDSPAPTLTGRCHSISNGRYGHPTQNRAISLREAAALQSFPDRYIFYGSNKHIALQIGNAVPVRFAQSLGRHLMQVVDGSTPGSTRPRRPGRRA
ncbi:unnamed protein product [Cladocopium goreaui]|uniref:DNA (cytosine-5-)-methyltransferase n=1 Tax=Cladocopium goreaui TaxID=2562237 RepID=A0A9P1BFR9_9DINO|nr:unnamed protein product [Cladocopium goreaui]